MSYLAIFKRVVPFLLTFAAGLLIASIFIPISAPSFRNNDGGGRRCRDHKRQMISEIESLREERDRLRDEVEQLRQDAESGSFKNLKYVVPPEIKIEVPAPPAPPARVQNHTHDR